MLKGKKKCKSIVNLYIVYQVNIWPYDLDVDFTLRKSLLGAAKFIKNHDPDKHSYSQYFIGFDVQSTFSLSNGDGQKRIDLDFQ